MNLTTNFIQITTKERTQQVRDLLCMQLTEVQSPEPHIFP